MSSENNSAIYRLTHTEPSRKLSVSCALELIKADLSSDVSASGNRNRLEDHVKLLSECADKIEAALNKKQP